MREHLRKTFDSETTVLLLAESNAEVVGYVIVDLVTLDETPFRWASRRVCVRQLGVTESARGYGTGRALMAAVEQDAQETGVDVGALGVQRIGRWLFCEAGVRHSQRSTPEAARRPRRLMRPPAR